MALKKSRKLVQKTMVEEPTHHPEVQPKFVREEEPKDSEDQEVHESEEEQISTVFFTQKQLEVLLKMNRLDFNELVMAFKGGSSKSAGCGCLACGNGRLHPCRQSWATLGCKTCPIVLERLCFHMVEDGEARKREEPWLHMGILQGAH